jgi:large subunit ribosomal protein L6
MSRIGRKPIVLPTGVDVRIGEDKVAVKGPLGELEQRLPPHVKVSSSKGTVVVEKVEGAPHRVGGAMQGLARALLKNMVVGVSAGYTRSLDLIGVGYRVKGEANRLTLSLGFTEPVVYTLPPGITFEIKDTAGQKENQVVLRGIDKAVIGQIAADLRRLRPPEPYKGKGIRYTGERIRHKAGKAGAR